MITFIGGIPRASHANLLTILLKLLQLSYGAAIQGLDRRSCDTLLTPSI
ncbi:hypothetical protein NYE39_02860 [Janibacter sp. FSL W8-0316]